MNYRKCPTPSRRNAINKKEAPKAHDRTKLFLKRNFNNLKKLQGSDYKENEVKKSIQNDVQGEKILIANWRGEINIANELNRQKD